jgi:hypothetical protein
MIAQSFYKIPGYRIFLKLVENRILGTGFLAVDSAKYQQQDAKQRISHEGLVFQMVSSQSGVSRL